MEIKKIELGELQHIKSDDLKSKLPLMITSRRKPIAVITSKRKGFVSEKCFYTKATRGRAKYLSELVEPKGCVEVVKGGNRFVSLDDAESLGIYLRKPTNKEIKDFENKKP